MLLAFLLWPAIAYLGKRLAITRFMQPNEGTDERVSERKRE